MRRWIAVAAGFVGVPQRFEADAAGPCLGPDDLDDDLAKAQAGYRGGGRTAAGDHAAAIHVLMNMMFVRHLVSVYLAFDGDLLAAIVLGIGALARIGSSMELCLVAFLVVGGAILLSGTAIGAKMVSAFQH